VKSQEPKPTDGSRDASAELLAKIQPAGGAQQPTTAVERKGAPGQAKTSSPLSAEELAKLPTIDGLGQALAAALQGGDLAAAQKLTLDSNELARFLAPAYHDILLGSIEEQNRLTLSKLMAALRDKKVAEEHTAGTVVRTPPRGPIVEGTHMMSGASLRLRADGVTIEVGLDQLILVGDQWKIFRLREP
jgi:hypothetical protein